MVVGNVAVLVYCAVLRCERVMLSEGALLCGAGVMKAEA